MTAESRARPTGALLRVLGVSFSVAVTLGSTIGVGILRTPGLVAAQLGNVPLVLAVWTVGGLYAILGTLAVAELATSLPQAGGWYVYARRALGEYAGFTIGWINWVSFCTATASTSIAIGEYVVTATPVASLTTKEVAIAVLLLFTLIHWFGVRAGGRAQEWTSFATAVAFLALIVVGWGIHGTRSSSLASADTFTPPRAAILVALALAFQSVIFAYDGWYGAIYFSEENLDPARNLPRSMITAVLVIVGIYLLVILTFLHILSFARLAASQFPAADAARALFGARGGQVITALSLLSLLGIINAAFMQTTRILYGMSRDGLFVAAAATVNHRGTPTTALLIGAVVELLLVVSGSFEKLLAVSAFFFVVMYGSGFISLFVLRIREPDWPRPFKAWGYPWTTVVVVALSCLFLIGVIVSDPVNSCYAVAAIALSYPLYLVVTGSRSRT